VKGGNTMQSYLIEDIVKEVVKQYIGGERYFDELDYRIKYNRTIIYALLGEFMGKDIGIALSGEFGDIVASIIDNENIPISYILVGGSPRRSQKLFIDTINGSANYYQFVDDSYFSGNTYKQVKDFIKKELNKHVSKVIKVAYDGSKEQNLDVYSFYRYYDHYDENGNEI
jgi:hypothetical protein